MSDMPLGSDALIVSVANTRLINMGIRPGYRVRLLRRKSGCLHIRVGTTEWAIRDSTAGAVEVSFNNKENICDCQF